MSDIDHRADAEQIMATLSGWLPPTSDEDALVAAVVALVHAILAAGTPVADQHVNEALHNARTSFDRMTRQYMELRKAARAVCISAQAPDGSSTVPVGGRELGKLWTLVAEVTS